MQTNNKLKKSIDVAIPRNVYCFFKDWTLKDIEKEWPATETGYSKDDQMQFYRAIRCFYDQDYREDGDTVWVTENYKTTPLFPGRLWNSCGLQGTVCALRSNFLKETADIDMRNAQPTATVFACRDLGAIETPMFDDYIQHRDERITQIMNEAGISKGEAKQCVIITLTYDQPVHTPSDYLKKLDKEAKEIQAALINRPELQWISTYCKKRKKNTAGSFMSHLYQFVERKLLMCVCDMLERDGMRIAALVFDGMNIADASHHGNQTILDNAHDACNDIAPGVNMFWAWKELDYVLKASDKFGKKPLTNADGSLRELRVPDDYTPPRKYKKGKFHHHKFEEIQHQGTSKRERGPSLNVSCVLSKSSCDLCPFQNIGFVSNDYAKMPHFNMDMFKQSLTLDVNPVSLEPQYYEIVEDPEANGFDGSSYVFDQKISILVTSLLATVGNARDCEMTRTYLLAVATALEKRDGCLRKLIHMPIMQRQKLQDDRFDLGENGNPAKKQKTSEAPFITELPALHVPHGDGQSVYEPNTDAGSVLLSSRVLVCVASLDGDEEGVDRDGEQITLSLGYDISQSPTWRLEVCTADNSSVFDSDDQPAPQDLLRRVLCLWEWSEVDLKDQRRKHASKLCSALAICSSDIKQPAPHRPNVDFSITQPDWSNVALRTNGCIILALDFDSSLATGLRTGCRIKSGRHAALRKRGAFGWQGHTLPSYTNRCIREVPPSAES